MSHRNFKAGVVLAERYELADLQSERLGASNWKAFDRVLHRNVRVEVLRSDDPRADHFTQAARASTAVTDPRFLQVLDVLENEQGHHVVIREWARAMPLSEVLAQSPLPNRRAATIVSEVAEALAGAHELGIFHRRLSPHHILLKESGAVRIVGLGVATSLAPVDHDENADDRAHFEELDVRGLGKLLYACLVSRWPGAHVDGLRAAPTEHGRLVRPRKVRAGVARDVDAVVDEILSDSPRSGHRLTRAADIAQALRLVGEDVIDDVETTGSYSSPDLLRLDPVIEPSGPPPGLEPPRKRPKAWEPAPPTRIEKFKNRLRESTQGDRAFRALGLLGFVVIIAVIVTLLVIAKLRPHTQADPQTGTSISTLTIERAIDMDPLGDNEENPDLAKHAIDGNPDTGWQTAIYLNNPKLGGLKKGVGLMVDLGAPHEVTQVTVLLVGTPSDIAVYTAPSTVSDVPRLDDLSQRARVTNAGTNVTFALPEGTVTRYVMLWFRSVPAIATDKYRGEIQDISILGR